MKNIRFAVRLDIKGEYLVKGIQLEGLRKLGSPNEFARKYYEQGIDEIIYIDIVASLYNRNSLSTIVEEATKNVFVPLTVGGGLRNLSDVEQALCSGADKIAINTAAVKAPDIITQVADRYGSQCMVLSIQAKKQMNGRWEVYYDNGREHTGIDAIAWAKQGCERGAGEILLTSVDRDGTKRGFDLELIREISDKVPIPVIACGGMQNPQDFVDAVKLGHADAVAAASILHYGDFQVKYIKKYAACTGIDVRM
ncbi:imidazole glycerol phosphate synthase cyclase subunit [Lachnospiraceae bacterium 47-T17]